MNIRFITDVGEVPYDVARPILLKVESADQLVKIPDSFSSLFQILIRRRSETDRRSISADLWT